MRFASAQASVKVRVGIVPDRDGADEAYLLTMIIDRTGQEEQVPITVHDEDDTVIPVRWRSQPRSMYFQDGPIFRLRPGAPATVVATYDLHDVIHVRWTGPSLNADQPKVLMETLEIAHEGLVPLPLTPPGID